MGASPFTTRQKANNLLKHAFLCALYGALGFLAMFLVYTAYVDHQDIRAVVNLINAQAKAAQGAPAPSAK